MTDPTVELQAAIDAQGLDLPAEAATRLTAYLAMLQQWNRVYNLTALRDAPRMVSHHLLDCLAVLPMLQRHADAQGLRTLRVLDVGSGGGLPGVVLAIARPAWTVTCVDTVAKKAGFIRQVAAELRLGNLKAVHARVEQAGALPPQGYDLITARAFASLSDLVQLTRPLLASGGVWAAMKGKQPEAEIQALPADVAMFHVEHLQVPGLDAERCLVWMRST